MPLLYYDSCFLLHDTGVHPERADRIRRIPQRLDEAGLARRCQRPAWEPVSRQQLARVHSVRYIDEVCALAKSGGGDLDLDTVCSASSYDVALRAAGSVCDATQRVLRGEQTCAVCLVRPPGHHALRTRAMGFCLFNNVAVAARLATDELGLDRVLIVDWDVHHGNGTQATFWQDPRVGFFSIHRWPFFPGSGLEDETGGGDGLGTTLNQPVPFGISRKEYLALFCRGLERLAEKIKPQMVYISAGWDTHRKDPVGGLGLELEDYVVMTNAVLDVADTHCEGRVISVLEGGYDPDVVAEAVVLHLGEMLNRRQSSSGVE
jgi:acetoin utilization deacetylase AcuC-like enzyme